MDASLRIIDDKNQIVAEGPVWDDRRGLLYTIDILGRTVRTTDLDTLEHTEVRYDQDIGCIVLREDGGLLAAMTDGIYEIFSDGSKKLFCRAENMKGRRFNDGKVGPDGRFYVGTTDNSHEGALYRVDTDGTVTEILDHVGCSNGIAWTADASTMYFVDSPDRCIEAFDFDVRTGEISGRRKVFDAFFPDGVFDGMTIDSEDMLWAASWGAHHAYRIDPVNNKVLTEIELPAEKVSCCAFAGSDLKTLVITTASKDNDLTAMPDAGKTFALQCEVAGMPQKRFAADIL